jgi:hypothetical protein
MFEPQDRHPANQNDVDERETSTKEDAIRLIDEYWAAERDPDELWSTLSDKETEFYSALERRNMFNMYRFAFSHYFGLHGASGASSRWATQSISFCGEDNELIDFSVNEFRSFADQIFNMQTKNRPSFEAQALNTDYKSLAQVQSCDTMVKYYFEEVYGERKEKEVVKIEGLYGKAYTHIEWDPDGGRTVDFEEEIPSDRGPIPVKKKGKAGLLRLARVFPWEVVCEPYRSELDDHLWRMVIGAKRTKVEMIARYPLFALQIDESDYCANVYEYQFPGCDPLAKEPEGTCGYRIFYHAITAAMPEGRRVVFVNNVMVDDGPLPIDDIPVYPFCTAELHGTSFGISALWNLLPMEQMSSQILSDMATNIEAFGRPPLALVEGSDIDLDALANGQKVIFIPPNTEPPKPIQFPHLPEYTFKVLDMLKAQKQSISGLNAIARGDTSTNITSGAHAALYSQIAVEAQSDGALNLDLHREAVANGSISFLKHHAKHPQLVAIVGVDERSYLEEFTAADWTGIQRVRIKTANPALKTSAGKMQLAELLRQWPGMPIKDPQQIIELVVSGQFKPAYQPTRSGELRIRRENEKLLKGPPVQEMPGKPGPDGQPGPPKRTVPLVKPLATDNVTSHLFGHLEVLTGPAAEKNPAIMEATLAHMLEHVSLARNGDPYLAGILGNPPPQQPGGVGPGGPPPGGQNGSQGSQPSDKTQGQAQKVLGADQTDDSKGGSIPQPAKPAQPPPGAAPQAA